MKIKQILICAVFTAIIFIIHMTSNVDSMLNNKNNAIDHQYINKMIDYHENILPDFIKRPIYTSIVNTASDFFNLSHSLCFVICNFIFLFLSGFLLYYLAKITLKKESYAVISVSAYYLCFSNLFAFFPPIYTYEEPLQFCLIFLSFIFLYKKKKLLYIISFSLAIITRESALILIPGLFLLGVSENLSLSVLKKQILSKDFILLVIPALIYFLFIYIFMEKTALYESSKHDFLGRFSHPFNNFQNKTYAIESICSFFLVLGMPIYLLIVYLKQNKFIDKKYQQYIYAFLITLVINTILVFTITKARESRLFVLPLFFLWPIFGLILQDVWRKLQLNRMVLLNLKNIVFFLIINLLNYIFSFRIYKVTSGHVDENYFDEYLFISILIISLHFVFSSTFKKIKKSLNEL